MDGVVKEVEGEGEDVRHIEHVKPRPLRPKPPVKEWGAAVEQTYDANGNTW